LGAGGNIAVIGAPQASISGGNSGTVEVFARVAGVWGSPAVLAGADTGGGDQFGIAVSVDAAAQRIVVGSWFHVHGGIDSGSAYVFRATGPNAWTQEAELLPSN